MMGGIDPQKAQAMATRIAKQRAAMVGTMLVNEIRQLISIPSRTVSYKVGRGGKRRKALGARGSSRSRPGEPPHMDTGALRASITYRIEESPGSVDLKVGTPLLYGRFLEMGTTKMAARPFLRRALKENAERIRQITEHGGESDIKVG